MKTIVIIPARAGSKSIKNKNIKKLRNKFLIAYPIETAKKLKKIDRIIISTDSKKIRNIGLKLGAEVPFLRPKKISGDKSLDIEYLKHLINQLKLKDPKTIIVILRATTPFRNFKLVDKAINIFKKGNYDSLRSVSVSKESPYKMWVKTDKKLMKPFLGHDFTKFTNFPRQKLQTTYWQNGYVDITKVNTVNKFKNEIGKKIRFFEIMEEIVEIDYKSQLKIAEIKTKLKKKDGKIYPS